MGANPSEDVDEDVGLVAPPQDDVVMPVLMFACNRVTVSKAVDLILKYRGGNRKKFPLIVSQVC